MDVTILQEETSTSLIRERYLNLIGGNVKKQGEDSSDNGKVNLAEVYKSTILPSVQEKVRSVNALEAEEIAVSDKEHRRKKPMYATPWWYQFLLLTKRDFIMTVRNPRVTVSQLIITLALSLLVVNNITKQKELCYIPHKTYSPLFSSILGKTKKAFSCGLGCCSGLS